MQPSPSTPGVPVRSDEVAYGLSRDDAVAFDTHDELRHLRDEFLIPSKSDLRSNTLPKNGATESNTTSTDPCIYLCGNSLGLQPRRTSTRLQQYLSTWATQGVFGHFKPLADSPLPTWLNVDDEASERTAPLVGASSNEVAVMQTLTGNLHLLMTAFYHPNINGRHKIILESKAFPSDHYAVESQIRQHGLDISQSMICLDPPSPSNPILSTSHILSIIDQHASTTCLLLLPGIQFYTGQYFDIPRITAHAQSKGIFVIWDLAHAVGNVPLKLHDWNVDAACWCTYKYVNAGPGAIAGMFVHERNSNVLDPNSAVFVNRLSGWWGSDKDLRFQMTNKFIPMAGARGFQLSNPSVMDCTALCASLEVFGMTDMEALRAKSLKLTAFLEKLLLKLSDEGGRFRMITPMDPEQRGAQLSLLLEEGLLDHVMEFLEEKSVVVDERRPDVIRIAPAPLYNTFTDVWDFVVIFREALEVAYQAKTGIKAGLKGTGELLQTT